MPVYMYVCRFWDFERGDNYVLDVQQHALITNEVITSISFNSNNGELMWSCMPVSTSTAATLHRVETGPGCLKGESDSS